MESDQTHAECTNYVRDKKQREEALLKLAEIKEVEKTKTLFTYKGKNGLVISTTSEERLEEIKQTLGIK